ncbi:MAG: hypothetical protein ACRDXX_03770 [Stackebrandtia sp.]
MSATLLAAACGQGADDEAGDASKAEKAFAERGKAVAEAWDDVDLDAEWTEDLVLLDQIATLPEGAELDEAQESGFNAGWYELDAELPDELPGDQAKIDGDALDVDVYDAQTAYDQALAVGGEPPADCPREPVPDETADGAGDDDDAVGHTAVCGVLTVVGAEPATTQRWTSRGMAELPAWDFAVEGVEGSVTVVAFEPVQATQLPQVDIGEYDDAPEGTKSAERLESIDDATVTFLLGVGACDTDPRPLAYEADDVVVVAGTAEYDGSEMCTDELVYEPVSVDLDAPLGDRMVVDGVFGRVLSMSGYLAG